MEDWSLEQLRTIEMGRLVGILERHIQQIRCKGKMIREVKRRLRGMFPKVIQRMFERNGCLFIQTRGLVSVDIGNRPFEEILATAKIYLEPIRDNIPWDPTLVLNVSNETLIDFGEFPPRVEFL